MHRNKQKEIEFIRLRERAEQWLQHHQSTTISAHMVHDNVRDLTREFRTYQVELELQNEDLRLAQTDLEQSRQRYAALYNHAPIGYLTVDTTGKICETNFTAASMLGVVKRQLLGRPFVMHIAAEDLTVYSHFLKKLFISSQKQRCDLRMKRSDNTSFHALLESKIDLDIDGNSGQFRIGITDITELKNLENTLRESKSMWTRTFDTISDAILIFDSEFKILRANAAALALLEDAPRTAKRGCPLAVCCNPETPCRQCPVVSMTTTGKPRSLTTTLHDSGRTFHITCAPLEEEGRPNTVFVQIIRDITTQKKMEEDLLQKQKMEVIGALAGGIAHDFNNILTLILGYADIVCATPEVPAKSRENVEQIVLAAARAKELIRQILTFSRKEHAEKTVLDLAPIIREAMKLMRASIPSTVAIQEEISADCGCVLANPINIHQVLVNLCTNAIHAMEAKKGGVLKVSLRASEGVSPQTSAPEDSQKRSYVELMVSDTGFGMSKEVQQRIFEPYFTTKNFEMGSGIGLAVVQGIVKECDGFITVDSEPGIGSTFRVYLPVMDHEPLPSSADVTGEQLVPLGNEHILLVDDELSIVTMSTLLLEHLGYTVTGLTGSMEALHRFSRDPDGFDLVITDQTMPELTGEELAARIRQIHPTIPILLCTGKADTRPDGLANSTMFAGVLAKPLARLDLANAVRAAIDR